MFMSSPGWSGDIASRKALEIEAFSIALQQYHMRELAHAAEGFRKLEQDFPLLGDIAAKLEIEALINENKLEEALKCYNKALELDPKNVGAWNNKGKVLANLGKHEEAIECYNLSL